MSDDVNWRASSLDFELNDLGRLDSIWELVHKRVAAMETVETMATVVACKQLLRYYAIAGRQLRRIEDSRNDHEVMAWNLGVHKLEISGDLSSEKTDRNIEAITGLLYSWWLGDVHAYLSAWKIVGQNLGRLAVNLGDEDLQDLALQFGIYHGDNGIAFVKNWTPSQSFAKYSHMRNHLDHIDERIPGAPNAKNILANNELSLEDLMARNLQGYFVEDSYFVMPSLDGHNLTIGDQTVDVGPESFKLLRTSLEKVADLSRRKLESQ